MTIRLETDPTGEPHTVWLDGTKYTLDELRTHLARSKALHTVVIWLADERATTRRQRKLLVHWQRYGAQMQTTARMQAEELARLRRKPERACYALEAAQRTTKEYALLRPYTCEDCGGIYYQDTDGWYALQNDTDTKLVCRTCKERLIADGYKVVAQDPVRTTERR